MMKRSIGMAIVILLTALTAFAGDKNLKPEKKAKKEPPTPEQVFKKMDTDGGGTLNFEEFAGAKLEKMKKNLAGKEGSEEKIAKSEKQSQDLFASKDADGNGALSLEEFIAKPVKQKPAKKENKVKKEHKVKKEKKANKAE